MGKKKIHLLLLSISLFSFFVLFSYLVHKDIFTQFDFNTTVRLQDKIPRKLDDSFSFLSDFGKFEVMTLALLVIVFVTRKFWSILAFLGYGVMHVLELYGKFFVTHPPPPEFLIRTKRIVDFPQFHVRADFSYPSGHAARAAFITVILCYMIISSKRLSVNQKYLLLGVLAIYDIVMFVSRVYLGEHWATDVIGGALLGGSIALLAVSFSFVKLFNRSKKV